jgi:hypothetical protein
VQSVPELFFLSKAMYFVVTRLRLWVPLFRMIEYATPYLLGIESLCGKGSRDAKTGHLGDAGRHLAIFNHPPTAPGSFTYLSTATLPITPIATIRNKTRNPFERQSLRPTKPWSLSFPPSTLQPNHQTPHVAIAGASISRPFWLPARMS